MQLIKLATSLILLLFILSSCQSVKNTLSMKKKKSVDEFLIEKKNPRHEGFIFMAMLGAASPCLWICFMKVLQRKEKDACIFMLLCRRCMNVFMIIVSNLSKVLCGGMTPFRPSLLPWQNRRDCYVSMSFRSRILPMLLFLVVYSKYCFLQSSWLGKLIASLFAAGDRNSSCTD